MCLTTACLSPRYRHASKKTPPAVTLDKKFPPASLDATLNTVIISGGPGSWKKEAYWDEYVLTLHNTGEQPLQVGSVKLLDFAGTAQTPGDDPWKLERESKSLAKRYQDGGMTVVRAAAPRVLATAAQPSIAAGAAAAGAGAATVATATAVAVPVYGATVLGINIHNKKSITQEFKRRRLALPLTLAAGETQSGSVFFPMVPNPRSLVVSFSSSGADGGESRPSESVLPLDFLQGLHVKETSGKD
ncbi:MAG: hypothetical protein JOZ12_15180 [Sinobacteraceae bacterium]|nr:hypothetical protein [Nevskiaceae bacterium]